MISKCLRLEDIPTARFTLRQCRMALTLAKLQSVDAALMWLIRDKKRTIPYPKTGWIGIRCGWYDVEPELYWADLPEMSNIGAFNDVDLDKILGNIQPR